VDRIECEHWVTNFEVQYMPAKEWGSGEGNLSSFTRTQDEHTIGHRQEWPKLFVTLQAEKKARCGHEAKRRSHFP
jgi:hypothetical protein